MAKTARLKAENGLIFTSFVIITIGLNGPTPAAPADPAAPAAPADPADPADPAELRRATVHIRVGKRIPHPSGEMNQAELQSYTDSVMIELARMLPPEYRGVYARMSKQE